jgi:hypothetical protein
VSIIRALVDTAVAEVIAEHPKWFSDKGKESARREITRKIMAAFREGGSDKEPDAPEPTIAPKHLMVEPTTTAGRGYINLRHIAGAVAPTRVNNQLVVPQAAYCEAVFAFADLPPQLVFVTARNQIGAWMEFFAEHLPGVARRPIRTECNMESGIWVPWLWPPAKDGKVYEPDEVAA